MRQEAELLYTTDTTMQNEPVDFQTPYYVCENAGWSEMPEDMCIYRPYGNYEINIVASNEIDAVVTKGEVGLPGDVVVWLASRTAPWQDSETETEEIPDIFAPSYQRKVLFSKQVEIQPGTLRRWKPHITIDPDMIAEDEDA
jgi:hypothetical protein